MLHRERCVIMANPDVDSEEYSSRTGLTGKKAKPLRWSDAPALILGTIVIPTVLLALFVHGVVSEMLRRIKRRIRRRQN